MCESPPNSSRSIQALRNFPLIGSSHLGNRHPTNEDRRTSWVATADKKMNRRTHSDFSLLVILVGCAFLAVGVFFLSDIIKRFHLANRFSNAVEVQANVLAVELKGSAGGGRSGGGTSRTVATYEFELEG